MNLSHPKGMYILAFTEIFERLSFYTLSFLLVLYASAPISEKGLGWSKQEALTLAGIYTLSAYVLPVFGSIIADKYLGHFRSILIGGVVIMLGHFLMFFSSNINIFYLALFFIASGTSFFKPCIPVLLGNLYKTDDPRRESGFCLYYCGINIGIMLAGIIGGLLLQNFGYHVALTSAGFGMIIGIIVFYCGRKHINVPNTKNLTYKSGYSKSKLTDNQFKAVISLIITLVFFCFWTLIYNLTATGTMSLFVEHYTNKSILNYEIPVTFFSSIEGFVILVSTPLITMILSCFIRKNKYPHFFSQINFALLLCALGLFYFSVITLKFGNSHYMPKPFQFYEVIIFIVIFSISESIINPVMMSAISLIAPKNYKSFFQSIYLSCYGISSILAAKIGARALNKPFLVFITLSFCMVFAAILYYFIKQKMIFYANKAINENKVYLKQNNAA